MGLEVSPMNGLKTISRIENNNIMFHITQENSNVKIFNTVCHWCDYRLLLYSSDIYVAVTYNLCFVNSLIGKLQGQSQ